MVASPIHSTMTSTTLAALASIGGLGKGEDRSIARIWVIQVYHESDVTKCGFWFWRLSGRCLRRPFPAYAQKRKKMQDYGQAVALLGHTVSCSYCCVALPRHINVNAGKLNRNGWVHTAFRCKQEKNAIFDAKRQKCEAVKKFSGRVNPIAEIWVVARSIYARHKDELRANIQSLAVHIQKRQVTLGNNGGHRIGWSLALPRQKRRLYRMQMWHSNLCIKYQHQARWHSLRIITHEASASRKYEKISSFSWSYPSSWLLPIP